MDMLKYKNIYASYFYQGQTLNGSGLYCINFFKESDSSIININWEISKKLKLKTDKKGNIKSISYSNMELTLKSYIDDYLNIKK